MKYKTDELFKKYPKLLTKKNLMFGIECEDGWYWLIDNLCACIQNYTDLNKKPQVTASQIKEKFGGLRFYTNGHDDLVNGMIWFAESLSFSICEHCGSFEGKPNKVGWIKTLCPDCKKIEDDKLTERQKEYRKKMEANLHNDI